MNKTKTILMCPPTYFNIEYEINPWMSKSNPVAPQKAAKEWQTLHDIYVNKLGWDVQLIEPVKGLPDMVFTANGGLVYNGKVILSRFRYPQRQPETEVFKKWFEHAGYQQIYMPKHNFEGEADGLIWNDKVFFGAYPFRSDKSAHAEIAEVLGLKPVSLELVDPRFYHLDTALTIISNDTVALYPQAFSTSSLQSIKKLVPNVIEASKEDALVYGVNSMPNNGTGIVLPQDAKGLIETYRAKGLDIYPAPIGEFQKSGGGVKCLTLELR